MEANLNIIFKNIRVLNPYDNTDTTVDLWIKNGEIVHCSLEEAKIEVDTTVIDAEKMVCSPGLFDMHVHFREPGQEYKETIQSGSESASNGGFTGVVLMPNTVPAIDSPEVMEFIKNKAAGNIVDIHCSAAITKERKGEQLTEMLTLSDYGALYFTDDGDAVSDTSVMRRAFDYAATKDFLLAQHCEEQSMTEDFAMNESELSYILGLKGYPTIAEDIIVSRDVMLADYCGNRRYHVSHISSKNAVEIIREAKNKGQRVSCEVTPHHFVLDDSLIKDYNPNHKMNPPLREQKDIQAVIEGLKDGTIDCIATDHAPHALHEKVVEYEIAPHGIIGLETSLGLSLTYLVHKGHLSLEQMIKKMCVNPRNLLGLPEIIIDKGENANVTIFDPNEDWTVDKTKFKTRSLNTPFNDYKLKGKPKYVINNGKLFKSEL